MENNKKFDTEFKVNEYITLKLLNGRTYIFIKGKLFSQCKFLLLNIPTDEIRELDDIESVDEVAEKLDSSLEIRVKSKYRLTPQTEFWGHCSNLQAWYENDYNTRLIHRNLAFPLLKKLNQAGDPLARRVFKEEIARRLTSGYPSVVSYLFNQGYVQSLNRSELNTVIEDPNFKDNLLKNINNKNYGNFPKWFYKKIRHLIPDMLREKLEKLYKGEYDAVYKVVLLGEAKKTAFIKRYCYNIFNPSERLTLGVDFHVKSLMLNDLKIKLEIWDFGEEKRFRFLLPTYVLGTDGILFVYDAANYRTLSHIDDWLMVVRKEMIREDIFPILVVGIIPDLEEERQVSEEEGIEIAKSKGVDGFIECNLRTGENVEETFAALVQLMLNNSGL